jgi:hypothetical protein
MNHMKSDSEKSSFKFISLNFLEVALALALAVAVVVLVSSVVRYSQYGFDFTDEGYYLLWIANPFNYGASTSQFGFFYHPLYVLFEGNITHIRVFNYLCTFGLASLLSTLSWRTFFRPVAKLRASPVFFLVTSASVATASFLVVCFELPQTPSYNTLLFQALLTGAIGFIFSTASDLSRRYLGYVLVGLSLWLAFMAKPPSAVALGILFVVYLCVGGGVRLGAIVVTAGTATILGGFSCWAIDGSIVAFAGRLLRSVKEDGLLDGGHTISSILRWDAFPLTTTSKVFVLLGAAALCAAIRADQSQRHFYRAIGMFLSFAVALAAVFVSINGYPHWVTVGWNGGFVLLTIPLACFLAGVTNSEGPYIDRRQFALAFVLILFPYVYAFGTNRPYWLNAEGVSFFWLLSGSIFLSATKKDLFPPPGLLPVAAVTVFFSSVFVASSLEHPMRQTHPLRLNLDTVKVGGDNLRLSSDFAAYIKDLRRVAEAGGFHKGMPILDLTGRSPGAVYVLSGVAPGAPWLPAGYAGSVAFAKAALDRVDCRDIAQAWLLIESTADLDSRGILNRYGADLERDYQSVGRVNVPANVPPAGRIQSLLKPIRPMPMSEAACKLSRGADVTG